MLFVVLGFMAYALWGHRIPGFMGHPYIDAEAVIEHLYLGLEGIMGIPISVCATFLFMYILFGCFMEKSGLGKFFVDLALSLAGHKPGGPAKVAVVGAGLFGMISGSSVANAVTTGNFVIPLMRKVGYSAEFSAGTVAAASTGGQIMPPIMGAAAFIMAEMTGISYVTIAIAAFLPSLLYYLGVFVIIHLESMKNGMQGISRELLPDVWETFKKRGYLLIPIVAIIMLLLSGYTPTRAALVAIGLTVVSSYFSKENRLMPKDYVEALTKGARGVLPVVAACAGAGVIVGCVTLTGVGLKVANAIVMLSGGNIFLVMALTMLASLFLGMGLPTTPKYIILSIMAVPAMVQQNVPVLAAHMFILYFGIMADVTPPVAMAAYASAGIARANPVQSGVIAFKLGIAGFIVPYLFVLNPELVLVGTNGFNTALMFVSTMLGVIGLGMVLTGYYRRILSLFERAVILAASLLLIVPGLVTDISGSVVLLGMMLWIKRSSQKEQATA
jgi:TRAP transporter 4TM/12TM fusion protein